MPTKPCVPNTPPKSNTVTGHLRKLTGAALLLPVLLLARTTAHPVQSCEAYNNLKHTRNTHHVVLDPAKEYTILKKHKGQYLLLLKDESPAQRWVDDDCFAPRKTDFHPEKTQSNTKKYKEKKTLLTAQPLLLVLSWHNTFCETHPRKQECRISKRSNDPGHLVLHGLWPQPRSNAYCTVPRKIVAKDKHRQWCALPVLDLKPETLSLMERYMPGYRSCLHRHEWIKHGTCYGTDPDTYYRDALSLTAEVDRSEVGQLLRNRIGRRITLGEIRRAFDRSFGAGAGQRVEMKCDRGLLSELWINLRGRGDSLKARIAAAPLRKSRCRSAIVDAPGVQH